MWYTDMHSNIIVYQKYLVTSIKVGCAIRTSVLSTTVERRMLTHVRSLPCNKCFNFFNLIFLSQNHQMPSDSQVLWADAVVIIYSICDFNSFEKAKDILENISRARSANYIPTLLLGNKTDLEHMRSVGVEDGHQVALEYNCQYYEVSAADNFVTINIAFQALLREAKLVQQQKSLMKRRRTSLVHVSKKLGAMFGGKKDYEFDKRRTSVELSPTTSKTSLNLS